jgi:alpha-2-macroglobulin family protein/MG2 domain-containing protein/macroglobulin-like protein
MKKWRVVYPIAVCLALASWMASAGPSKSPKKIRKAFSHVIADEQFVPGTKAALRVVTRGVTGLLSSRPLPKARVTVSLASKKPRKSKVLFRGRSDAAGIVKAEFTVPDWPDGAYQMNVVTQYPAGKDKLSRTVTLQRTGKILLVTDKPIYQPGQLIHMRALALNAYDLKPLNREKILFQVMDPKGNKVFKKHLKTSAYGVSATEFQLADEIILGNYQIEVSTERAELATPAIKTLVVKKYVLPKFKVEVETDKQYYLPKQTIKGKIQADYFFGKPVAGSEVTIKASTFDVAFKEFASLTGTTDENGTWEFELKLPDYFVGQPLQKGDAIAKLEVKVKDTADHKEKSTKSIPVAATPIRVDAVPEGGRLVAGVLNQIYVVATYPDGSPAQATVSMKRDGKELGQVKTDATGLGVLPVTPRVKDMRFGAPQKHGSFGRDRRRFGKQRPRPLPRPVQQTRLLDLVFTAADKQGNKCEAKKSFSTDSAGDQILVRTDKAIYKSGDTLKTTILTSGGSGSCYVDIIKNRQTLLTKSVALKNGKATLSVPLGNEVFGTLELHAYKILKNGEIMRDARVIYVQPRRQLRIKISQDKKVYRPGEDALFKFKVLDTRGRAATAALGVIIVDEAVYALQELKPGLEKVYFTLEKELTKPKYQIEFGPSANLATFVKAEKVQAQKQRVAKVLLAKAKPLGNPSAWPNPVSNWLQQARQKAQRDRNSIQNAIFNWVRQHPAGRQTPEGKWTYRKRLVQQMVKAKVLAAQNSKNPFGDQYSIDELENLWPDLAAQTILPAQQAERYRKLRLAIYAQLMSQSANFSKLTEKNLSQQIKKSFETVMQAGHSPAKDVTGKAYSFEALANLPSFKLQDMQAEINDYRAQRIYLALSKYGEKAKSMSGWHPGYTDKNTNAFVLPDGVLQRLILLKYVEEADVKDIWGRPFRLVKKKEPRPQVYCDYRLRFLELTSLGPDGKSGTADDLVFSRPLGDIGCEALSAAFGTQQQYCNLRVPPPIKGYPKPKVSRHRHKSMARPEAVEMRAQSAPMGMAAKEAPMADTATAEMEAPSDDAGAGGSAGPAAPKKRKVRVREFFPETLLFAPLLKTTNQGAATLKVSMADSITTWRMTASANANQGGLGSVSHPVRVFQDFFVDIDLPVSLTQNDEVSIPVVVYNYLKKKQRVRLEMKQDDWFQLTGSKVQEMELEPNEVSSTYYRIKVVGLGRKTLQVRADGSNMSDAIRRQIEVLPDGQEANIVANGRIDGTFTKTIDIPASAVPGASKILVRMYPGVFSQVLEGMESMLRLPGG